MKAPTDSPKDHDLKPNQICVKKWTRPMKTYSSEIIIPTSRVSRSDSISQIHYSTSIYIPLLPLKHQQQLSTPTGMFVDKDGLVKYTMWRWRLDCLSCASHPTVVLDASKHTPIQPCSSVSMASQSRSTSFLRDCICMWHQQTHADLNRATRQSNS